jgi:putative hydrolase of the HAD superfamily
VFCFDLDDTLVSETEYVESGLRAAGELLDRDAPGSRSAEWMVALWRRARPADAFQQALARVGADPARWLPRLRAAYREHRPALTPRPGALDLLGAITRRGDRLALISDGDLGAQRRKWEALALPHRFDPVVFTDEHGRACWKPSPFAYRRVMAAHPDARGFVYVGDNPAKDFVAPNALGWTTVQVLHPANLRRALPARGTAAAPGHVVSDLAGVLAVATRDAAR